MTLVSQAQPRLVIQPLANGVDEIGKRVTEFD
jgi:hypothetical protein